MTRGGATLPAHTDRSFDRTSDTRNPDVSFATTSVVQKRVIHARRVSWHRAVAITFQRVLRRTSRSLPGVYECRPRQIAARCSSHHSVNRHRRMQHSSDRTKQRRSRFTERDGGALSRTMSKTLVDTCPTDGNRERLRGLLFGAATVSIRSTQQLQEHGSPDGAAP